MQAIGLSRKRKRQAFLNLFPLLIPYSEAANLSNQCLIGGVMRPRTASGNCPVYGRACEGSNNSEDNFKCGVAFNNVCISIRPVSDLSQRCYNESQGKQLNVDGYKKWKDFFDKKVPAYCASQSGTNVACDKLTDKLGQIKAEFNRLIQVKEISPSPSSTSTSGGAHTGSAAVTAEDERTEAGATCIDNCKQEGAKEEVEELLATVDQAAEASNLKFLPVCERTEQVKKEIMKQLSTESCENITQGDLLNIKQLNLRTKVIESLKPGDFSGLLNLEILDLSNNRLEELHKDQFKDNKKLRKLSLYENHLKNLHPKQFKHNLELRELLIKFKWASSKSKIHFLWNGNGGNRYMDDLD